MAAPEGDVIMIDITVAANTVALIFLIAAIYFAARVQQNLRQARKYLAELNELLEKWR